MRALGASLSAQVHGLSPKRYINDQMSLFRMSTTHAPINLKENVFVRLLRRRWMIRRWTRWRAARRLPWLPIPD